MWCKRQNQLLSDLQIFNFSEENFSWPVIYYFSHLAEAFARKMGLFFFFFLPDYITAGHFLTDIH